MQELPAIEGGKPLIKTPPPIGPEITKEDVEAVVKVLWSRKLASTVGEVTRTFEREFARTIGVKHAIAVCNGTAALFVALKAIGVGPGDEVIVPSFTFIATATAVLHANAIPVFADIDPETFTISPESVEKLITPRTKAIIPVHLFGHPAEMDEIMRIAEEHGIYVLEDSAQAIGAYYKGRATGSLGHVAAFSFYPTKNITCGEGGMITTNDDEIAERARLIRDHGQAAKYYHVLLGYNLRMTELQAALGLSQLRRLNRLNEARRRHVKIYNELLRPLENEGLIRLPRERPYVRSSWSLYEILLEDAKLRRMRDKLFKAIRAENAPITIAYPRVLYENPVFKELHGHGHGCPWSCSFYRGSVRRYRGGLTPVAEDIASRCLTLPTDPIMGAEGATLIARAVVKVLHYYASSS